jgi:uncharacterized protein (TIGR00661 family)
MKILYGINGTGNGHIVKSMNIISELRSLGHEVDMLISGNNHQLDIDVKYKFNGFSFSYNKTGSIDYLKTATNLKPLQFIKDIRLDIKSYDKVVTDFEPVTAWACKISKKDCIGVSHQYSFLSDKVTRPDNHSLIGEFVLNKMSPVSHPIGLHFRKYDDFILHPVIRRDILESKINNNGSYVVYLPSYSAKRIIHELDRYPNEFFVFTKEVKNNLKIKNINLCPSSVESFMKRFVNCKGVITSAGFETPSEALYLKKDLLVIPIEGQYEQLCNAESLKEMGVPVGKDITDIRSIFESNHVKDYEWDNPMNTIMSKILS